MKILFFTESLRPGGKERRLVELLKGLGKYSDISIELVITERQIHYKEIFDLGIRIHYLIRKGIKKDPRLLYKFYKIAKKFKPDIIHVWGNMVAFYAIPAKVLLRIPLINNQIADAPLKVNSGIMGHKIPFWFSEKIIANSNAGLNSYGVSVEKSMVIYNGFDFKRIKSMEYSAALKETLNIGTSFVVGMVASINSYKDYPTFIRVANEVIKKFDDVTFLCIGEGDSSDLTPLVDSDCSDRIRFLGKQAEVEKIMNICDVGVLTTKTEGFPNSVMEFMALKKPVVISAKGGGVSELVENKKSGFLFPFGDFEGVANKIIELLETPNERIKVGEKAFKRIRDYFNIDQMIKEYISLYYSFNPESK